MDLERCRYIVVEGPIGAGKTSLARQLAEHLDAEMLLEQPEDNPFLSRFYDDMAALCAAHAAHVPVPARRPAARAGADRHVPAADRLRLPARQGSAVRADQPDGRRVRAVREGLQAPEAADRRARPRDLPAGARGHAGRARADARGSRSSRRYRTNTSRASPTRIRGSSTSTTRRRLLIINSERLNFVDNPAHMKMLLARVAGMRSRREFFNLGQG